MKQYATSATLVATNGRTKTYEVEYMNKKGERVKALADGSDMSDALNTILKQNLKNKLSLFPSWVYLLSFSLFLSLFSLAVFMGSIPVLSFIGLFGLILAGYVLDQHLFKYVK